MSRFTKTTCNHCQVEFEKENRYLNRNIKLGLKNYCSSSCAGKDRIKNNPKLKNNIKLGSQCDKFSPFRKLFQSCKDRSKFSQIEFDLDIEYIYNLFYYQNGLCALSGIKMLCPINTREGLSKNPFMLSLDRIDSNKGYTKNNVQFVCLIAQYAKNIYNKYDLDVFCKAYYNHNNLGE